MNDKALTLIPLLAALLACKNGEAPARETTRTSPPSSAAAPDFGLVSAHRPAAPAKGRISLPVVVGKVREQHGFLVIPGEVRNDSAGWVRSVRVGIQLLDADGKPVAVSSIAAADGLPEGVIADRTLIPPGEVGVFRYTRDLKKLARPYATYQLSADGRATHDRVSAAVSDIQTRKDDLGFYTVSGKLSSSGPDGCRSPQAVIALYASDGKVWDVKSADVDAWFQKVLPQGRTVEFSRRAIDGRSGDFQDIKVWGDCRP